MGNIRQISRYRSMLVTGFIFTLAFFTFLITPMTQANSRQQIEQIQQQIEAVERDTEHKHEEQGILNIEASSLQDAINKFQSQINASQARINKLKGQVTELEKQIVATEKELVKQQDHLADMIRAIYVDGDMSTLEMLASSNDLNDYLDKQQYRATIKDKLAISLEEINRLKLELETKRATIKANLEEQQELNKQLAEQKAEKDRILALNRSQQASLENEIKANSAKLSKLKKQRADAEAALNRALNSGSYRTASVGWVSAGAVVGTVGNSGLSSGPHLHLEMRSSGNQIMNPGAYIKNRPIDMPPGWVSQGYGVSNPLYSRGYHGGIDYASNSGSPIYAIDSGTMYRGCSNDLLGTRTNPYGYVAIVEHSNGTKSIYAHMSGGPSACSYNTYY